MTTNDVAKLCDRCLKAQGQTELGEAIVEKIERGSLPDHPYVARVTFDDGYKVLLKMKTHDVEDAAIITKAIEQRGSK